VKETLRKQNFIAYDTFRSLVKMSQQIFMKEPNVLNVDSPTVNIVGDIHGKWSDLDEVFEKSSDKILLFLGDIPDRGMNSVECLTKILISKVENPQKVFLIRGNHEDMFINAVDGFGEELLATFGNDHIEEICAEIIDLYSYLPLAAILNNNIYCAHGGIPKFNNAIEARNRFKFMKEIERTLVKNMDPVATRSQWGKALELVQDITWSDPSDNIMQKEMFVPSDRGLGYLWSEKASKMWCQENNFLKIIRAHQCVRDGILKSHDGLVVTLFSHSNYVGGDNNAAILSMCNDGSFEEIKWTHKENAEYKLKKEIDLSKYFSNVPKMKKRKKEIFDNHSPKSIEKNNRATRK